MKKIKKMFSVILTVAVMASIYLGTCYVLIPKKQEDTSGTFYLQGCAYKSEPQASDVIVFGNSDAYSGFSPCFLYSECGVTSYVSGVPLQTAKGVNARLADAIRNKKPRVAILEVDCLYQDPKYAVPLGFLTAPFFFHKRWKELTPDDFTKPPVTMPGYDIDKGFRFSSKRIKTADNGYMNKRRRFTLSDSVQREAKIFVENCKKNDIKVIFSEFPSVKSWNGARSAEISCLAKKLGVDFYDFNDSSIGYKIDFDGDFRDGGNHLNVIGAEKVTGYLENVLLRDFGDILEDRRQDKNYAYWNDALTEYNRKKMIGAEDAL